MSSLIPKKQIWITVRNMSRKNRVEYIDIARGIAILLMIVGHIVDHDGWIRKFIFSFHMPLFFIVTGFFYRDKPWKSLLIGQFKKILVPYMLAVLIVDIIQVRGLSPVLFLSTYLKQLLWAAPWSYTEQVGHVIPVYALWFLPAMWVACGLFQLQKQTAKSKDGLLGILCFGGMVLSMLYTTYFGWLPFCLDIAFVASFLIYIGYMFRKYQVLEQIRPWMAVGLALIWWMGASIASIEMANRSYPWFLLCILVAIAGTTAVFLVSKQITQLPVCGRFLAQCGQNTFSILIVHYFDARFVNYAGIYAFFGSHALFAKLCVIVIRIGIAVFLSRIYATFSRKIKDRI